MPPHTLEHGRAVGLRDNLRTHDNSRNCSRHVCTVCASQGSPRRHAAKTAIRSISQAHCSGQRGAVHPPCTRSRSAGRQRSGTSATGTPHRLGPPTPACHRSRKRTASPTTQAYTSPTRHTVQAVTRGDGSDDSGGRGMLGTRWFLKNVAGRGYPTPVHGPAPVDHPHALPLVKAHPVLQ